MPESTPTPTKRDVLPAFRNTSRPDTPRLGILRDEIDRLFDLFSPFPSEGTALAGPRGWTTAFPAMDMAESADAYDLSIELPGLGAEDVEVRLKDGTLVVSGEKSDEHKENRADRHLSERRWSSFRRSLALPTDADPARIEATFARGVLKLHLPKSPAALASEKTIPVKES
ncbi:MAG: Hsp20/alpha crystallin family protein [Rhodobacteraceae bacterium]|nr:Hsp20/alpha crystallin family protein [Paracoccaceae bacterium]